MKNTMRRIFAGAVIASAALFGPAVGVLADTGIATASAEPNHHHTGPDYQSVTGWRVGAPSEAEVSIYGGSHKHLWIEQQLYGTGVVGVPQVDNSVHQSR
jgi:hypothetical protein